MFEFNWSLWWWRNWIGKKRDFSCKIFNEIVVGINEIVVGIKILFKEKDSEYLEFFFLFYMDDLICKDYDWELFDCFFLRKK